MVVMIMRWQGKANLIHSKALSKKLSILFPIPVPLARCFDVDEEDVKKGK